MVIEAIPTGAALGAEVRGVDLSRRMSAAEYTQVEAALARYGMIFFRGQSLSVDQQEAFIESFGPPNVLNPLVNTNRIKNPHFFDVSNVGDDDKIMRQEDERRIYLLANMIWHSDMSMRQPPARVSALHALVLPEIDPPDTQFVDTRNGYDRLSEAMKRRIERLVCEHSIRASRAKVGYKDFSKWTTADVVQHPLVRTHPGSGRKSLYIGAHVLRIAGLSEAESDSLLEELTAITTRPELIYSHAWQIGDLVVWDNSCTMHRATPFDDSKFRRELRWCSTRELEPV